MVSTLDDIMFLFDKNFGRTKSLIQLYSSLTEGQKGRRTTETLDLLRVTIVMLHSTMEDFLRNILNWRLPIQADKDILSRIPLSTFITTDIRKTKFELGDLLSYDDQSKTIQNIIAESIQAYLNTVSFNTVKDITGHLKNIKIEITNNKETIFPLLEDMIQRRHNIVHQADRDYIIGGKIDKIKSIRLETVIKYQRNVDKFVLEITKELRKII